MLAVIWSASARADVHELISYLSDRSPTGAAHVQSLIAYYADRAASHPYVFREGRVPGTREIVVHPNYVLIYRVEADALRILNVMHASRRYP